MKSIVDQIVFYKDRMHIDVDYYLVESSKATDL